MYVQDARQSHSKNNIALSTEKSSDSQGRVNDTLFWIDIQLVRNKLHFAVTIIKIKEADIVAASSELTESDTTNHPLNSSVAHLI